MKATVRASGLGRALACPGSAQAEAAFPPSPDNPASARGRRLHDGMALAFRIGLEPAVKKLEALWGEGYKQEPRPLGFTTGVEADLQAVRMVHEAVLHVLPDGAVLHVEQPLDMAFMGLASGKPDLVAIAGKQALIEDHKFGNGLVEDPATNPQLWAYAAGVCAANPGLEAVNLAIVQPGAWQPDQALREVTVTVDQVRTKAKELQAAVKVALQPDAPRVASKEACRWCRAREGCAEAKAMLAGVATAKAEVRQAELALVSDGTPIEVKLDPQLPGLVVVVSAELMSKAEDRLALAKEIKVVDESTANNAGALSKDIRGLARLVDEQRQAVKAPFLDACRRIDEAPKAALAKLKEADNLLQGQVTAWLREQQEVARKAQAEADALRRKAEEAQRKEQEALAKADRARTEAGRAKAEAAVAKAREAAMAAQLAEVTAPPVPVAPSKVEGFSSKEEVTVAIPDLSKVPAAWANTVLLMDERAVKALVKQGKLNEAKGEGWLVITRQQVAARGR